MSKLSRDDNGQVTIFGALGTTQVMTVTTSSVQSTAVATGVTILRLANGSGVHCHFQIGSNPTASLTTSPMLPANAVEYVACASGDKVAVIRSGLTATDVSITQIG
tara:strand:- start:2391 stop:2708 length:318 start_codon:yes stop_codon:yes gene_type:complete